jgi:hypothetical protein
MDFLTERYFRHVYAAFQSSHPSLRAWHIAAARGLYRLLADIELEGGPPAPMGLPHFLCMSDAECRALAVRS